MTISIFSIGELLATSLFMLNAEHKTDCELVVNQQNDSIEIVGDRGIRVLFVRQELADGMYLDADVKDRITRILKEVG